MKLKYPLHDGSTDYDIDGEFEVVSPTAFYEIGTILTIAVDDCTENPWFRVGYNKAVKYIVPWKKLIQHRPKLKCGDKVWVSSVSEQHAIKEKQSCDFIALHPDTGRFITTYGYTNTGVSQWEYIVSVGTKPETKEMTVDEISEALGYDVKVVK